MNSSTMFDRGDIMEHFKNEVLIDYLEDELGEKGKISIEQHIKNCNSCAAKLESFRATFSLLDEDDVPQVSSEKWATFLPDIYEKLEKPTLWQRVRSIFNLGLIPEKIFAPTISLVLALTFIIVFWGPNPNQQPIELETILTQTDTAIEEIDHLIDDDQLTDFDDIALDVFSGDLTNISLDIETDYTDISMLIDDNISDKVDYMDEWVYQEMDFNDILDNLGDDEIENIIKELEKKFDDKNSV